MSQVRVLPGALGLGVGESAGVNLPAVPNFSATVMLLTAAVLLYLAIGTLSNLWADAREDSVATYVAVGGIELIAAGAAAAVGIWLARSHDHDRD